MDFTQIQKQLRLVTDELFCKQNLHGKLVVLGCSSSEVMGVHIGKGSSAEAGRVIVKELLQITQEKGAFLAVQCCEHLNRALVVERAVAESHRLCLVSAVPALHAGGSGAVAAFQNAKDPVLVECIAADFGIDIGDTFIGMHVRHVQIPFRPSIKEIGNAHISCLRSRPKLIGGERAMYGTEHLHL